MLARVRVLVGCSLPIVSLEGIVFVVKDIPADDQVIFRVGIDEAWLIYMALQGSDESLGMLRIVAAEVWCLPLVLLLLLLDHDLPICGHLLQGQGWRLITT